MMTIEIPEWFVNMLGVVVVLHGINAVLTAIRMYYQFRIEKFKVMKVMNCTHEWKSVNISDDEHAPSGVEICDHCHAVRAKS